ncbi:MAG: hypothetical protein HY908_29490 [Myxococcales bacterium]|nr:hypothetical protein [Myxococcales bacterium]
MRKHLTLAAMLAAALLAPAAHADVSPKPAKSKCAYAAGASADATGALVALVPLAALAALGLRARRR